MDQQDLWLSQAQDALAAVHSASHFASYRRTGTGVAQVKKNIKTSETTRKALKKELTSLKAELKKVLSD